MCARTEAGPTGGGGAWPGFETTHRATYQRPGATVWRAPEGPEGTGGLRGAAPNEVRTPSLAGGRDHRRPQHPWGHKQRHAVRTARGRAAAPGHTKPPGPSGVTGVGGICRGAGGRRRGLAGLFTATRHHW